MDTTQYFSDDRPVASGTLPQLFFEAVDKLPDSDAFWVPKDGGYTPVSHTEFLELVRCVSGGLAALGLQPGDRIALLSENRLEWAACDYACVCSGLVDVPIYSTITAAQVAFILKDSGAQALFVSDQEQLDKAVEAVGELGAPIPIVAFDVSDDGLGGAQSWDRFLETGAQTPSLEEFRARAEEVQPEDLATLIYTSGTTGDPKGVMLSHGNLFTNVDAGGYVLQCKPSDRTLSFLPLCHVFQRMVDYLFFRAGVVIVHGNIQTVAQELKDVRPTVVVSVPRLYEKVYQAVVGKPGFAGRIARWAGRVAQRRSVYLEAKTSMPLGLRLSSFVADRLVFKKVRAGVGGRLRYFVSGGAPLAPDVNRFFHGAGVTILEGYGLTETSPVTNVNGLEYFRIGTVGRPVRSTEIKIADDGEILVRGPQVMIGYYNRPEDTKAAIDEDGWFKTGDIGELSKDGFLKITDRKKALMKTAGGKYIAPAPIENSLKGSPFIDQALVLGDGKAYSCVLIVPAFDRLAAWASETGVEAKDPHQFIADPRVHELYEGEMGARLRDFARFETPKKIGLLSEAFTIAGGTLTATQKVRRREVLAQYGHLVERFYDPAHRDTTVFF